MRNRYATQVDPDFLMRVDKAIRKLKRDPSLDPTGKNLEVAEMLFQRAVSGTLRQNDDFVLISLEEVMNRTLPKSPASVVTPNPVSQTSITNPILNRLDEILKNNPNQFIESLRNQVLRGRRLSQKQLEAIEKFEKPQTSGVVDEELLGRIDTLRSSIENPFLESVRQQVARGRKLSQKQLDAISRFETTRSRKASALFCAKSLTSAGFRISSVQDISHFLSMTSRTLKRASSAVLEAAPDAKEVAKATARLDAKIEKESHSTDKYVWEKVFEISKKLEPFGYLTNISKRDSGRFDLNKVEFYVLSSGETLSFDRLIQIANRNPPLRQELNALHGFHTFAKGMYTGDLDPKIKNGLLGKFAGIFEAIANFFRRPLVNIIPALLGGAAITTALYTFFYGATADVSAITTGVIASILFILGPHVLRWLASKAQGAFNKLKFRLASDKAQAYKTAYLSFLSFQKGRVL